MLPIVIEDYIEKLLRKSEHPEKRQFYYATLVRVRDAINVALSDYDKERNFRK
jgi:hypothetical protein